MATRAAKDLTPTIPIVMALNFDPCGGWVRDQSGACRVPNITGVSALTRDLSAKRLELLKDLVPGLARVAVVVNPVEVSAETAVAGHRGRGPGVGASGARRGGARARRFRGRIRRARQGRAEGLAILADPVTFDDRARLVDLVAQSRLPTIYWDRVFAEAGGLMSYAASSRDMNRRAAYLCASPPEGG